jgi:hypothetical protein
MIRFRAAPELTPQQSVIDPAMQVENAALKSLYLYWNRVRGTRTMPARSDLTPGGMRAALPWIQLYEPVDNAADFRVRLVGTALTEAAGVDETGLLVSQSRHRNLAQIVLPALRFVVAHARPIRGAGPLIEETDAEFLAVEGIWLPLSNDGMTVHLVLAATQIVMMDKIRLSRFAEA